MGFKKDEAGVVTDFADVYVRKDFFIQGNLWTWGYNNRGQLGDNTIINKSSPVQTVAGGTNWKQIECGDLLTSGIKTDGTLWGWGGNSFGQIGDNSAIHRSSPVQTVAGGNDWGQVERGATFSAAIKTDGTLWMWGYNVNGQLGDNSITVRSSPVQTVTGGSNWKAVACGYDHTVALKTDGSVWTWGNNNRGQIGDNTIIKKSSPIQVGAGSPNVNDWAKISGSRSFTAAMKTDGTLWTWGSNSSGELGDNSTAHKSSPVQTVAGGNDWGCVSAGEVFILAVKTDGTLWTWGDNDLGELGDNTVASKSSPIQTVAGGNEWKTVATGDSISVATKTDGSLWTWGDNDLGELGDNTVVHRSSPVQTVAGGNDWRQVAVGDSHILAITEYE